MLRPNLISLWIVYDLYIFIKLIKEKEIKRLLNIIIYSIIGAIITMLPTIIYLIVNNAFIDFINAYLVFNFKYSNIKEYNILYIIYYFIEQTKYIIIIIVTVAYIFLIYWMHKNKIKDKMLLIVNFIYFIFTFGLVVIPQRDYIHYEIIMLPTLLLAIIFSIKKIEIDRKSFFIIISSIISFLCIMLGLYSLGMQNISKKTKVDYIINDIQEITEEGDNVLVLGNKTYIYILSNRQYEGKYFYQLPIAMYSEEILNDIIKEIESNLPVVIVNYYIKSKYSNFSDEIEKILNKYYTTENEIIYVKRGKI